tara:strand:- start:531 stop:2318 length:1788 start_codon:yes stop_codon:yes gene_type:complete
MSVYKKLLPQDYSITPFNANKQYTFNSASAASNNCNYYSGSYNSSSIDLFDSGNIKYHQIDHLFYRNYKTELHNKFGSINYLKQKRVLYNTVNILSIPSGLYGHKIKPGSFFISSSNKSIVDDSYGNLLFQGTNIDDYCTNFNSILLDIGPVKGFKKYDLNIIEDYALKGFRPNNALFYKKGQSRVNKLTTYSTPSNEFENDDSYFNNKIYYKSITFSSSSLYTSDGIFSTLEFSGTSSELKINHDSRFNFNPQDDLSIEFWANTKNTDLSNEVHIIGKSTTKTVVPSPLEGTSGMVSLSSTGSSQTKDISSETCYPFEIYIKNDSVGMPFLHFRQSDGDKIKDISAPITTGSITHIVCTKNNTPNGSDDLSILINGVFVGGGRAEGFKTTQNSANLYIGNKGGNSNYFSGSISQLKIYNKSLSPTQALNHYKSSNGSPYIGNIFYPNGLLTITHPDNSLILSRNVRGGIGTVNVNPQLTDPNYNSRFIVGGTEDSFSFYGITQLKFQGSHLIYEYEYQCTIDEYEFNDTLNTTVRKNPTSPDIASFATGPLFKPYITTVGLYNENYELLAVGKLGQPLRTSNETDTTLIVRWDT